jgi:hypothetical protein
MYEIHDLAGDRIETGFGETVFESATEAVAEAMTLGRDAVEQLQKETLAPGL